MGRTTKNSISTYIDDDLLASVDRLSTALGKSRASTIKWVLLEFQSGMDMISETLETVDSEVKVPVSSFLKIVAQASALIGQKTFNLASELEHDNAGND